METLTGYKQVNLYEMVEELGEDIVSSILSNFSCPLNPDVESFLRNKSILFSKQSIGATHLVFTSYKQQPVLVGYYTLTYKPVVIKGRDLSSRWRHRLSRFASYDEIMKQYFFALPLIGQLGKNYANDYNTLISGDELLKMACDKIRSIQLVVSGKIAYLECEDIPKLTALYERNGFFRFANRNLAQDELSDAQTPYLVQMLKYFE